MEFSKLSESIQSSFNELSKDKTTVVAIGIGAGCIVLSGFYLLYRSSSKSRSKPSAATLSGGNLERKAVRDAFTDYSNSYGKDAGSGIINRDKTVGLVDTFYNLVTDFYEWGWGESFHFSTPLPGQTEKTSEVAHEVRIATLCNLRPGMKCIDCGCGVGGPMRIIASYSGAEITGVTINEYQVQRANYHNKRYGVDALCKAQLGSFLNLDFPDNTFDAAYAIEATCHAPDVQKAYGEIFRVIKPGSIFVSYEWVTTPSFDPKNPEHVKAIDDINYGNGLPEMRSAAQCIEAAKNVGFEVVKEYDLATESSVCIPWYVRLEKIYSHATIVNRAIVNVLSTLRLVPSGLKQVHDMLVDAAAAGLVIGGKEGIFTPMHLLVFQKPVST